MTAGARDLTWVVLALILTAVCLLVALPVGSMVGSAFGESALVRLAVAAGVWPLLASLTTTAAAWLMLDRSADRALTLPVVVGIAGSVASAVCAAALVTWTESHFGRFDPEYVGPTLWLPVLVGGLTVGATWMLGLRGVPAQLGVLVVAVASALIAGLAVLNLPGLFDGVTARGLPMMLAFGSAGVAIVVGALVSVLEVRAGSGRVSIRRGGPRGE